MFLSSSLFSSLFLLFFFFFVIFVLGVQSANIDIEWKPENAPYADQIAYPNDRLGFTFPTTQGDTVYLMTKGGFENCDFSPSSKSNLTIQSTARFKLTDNPPFPKYYASESGCSIGQKIKFNTQYLWTSIPTLLINKCSSVQKVSNRLIGEIVNLASSSSNCKFFTDSTCGAGVQVNSIGDEFATSSIVFLKCDNPAVIQTVTASGPGGALNGVQTFIVVGPLVATVSSKTNVLCYGASTGSLDITVTGGYGNHTFVWSDDSSASTGSRSVLSVGVYNVTITDGMQTIRVSVNITQPDAALSFTSVIHSNPTCVGTLGTIGVVVSGGVEPYTYLWSDTQTASSISVGVGNYTVDVTDANNCPLSRNFSVVEPDPLSVTTVKVDALCFQSPTGWANSTVTGGTGPYTYAWSTSPSTEAIALNLTAGSYTVTVTDSCMDTATSTISVGEPTSLALTPTQSNVKCNGGSTGYAEVAVSGGTPHSSGEAYSYSWENVTSSTNASTSLIVGVYTVVVTDSHGCIASHAYTITEPLAIAVTPSTSPALCHGGSSGMAWVNVTGGTGAYNYTWSPSVSSTNEAGNLPTGNYSVLVTDEHLCQYTQPLTVAEPPLYSLVAHQVEVACHGGNSGSATVDVSGGTPSYTYSWTKSGNSTVLSTNATAPLLSIGSYTVSVTDANNCPLSQSFTITQPDQLAVSITAKTNVACNAGSDGSVTVDIIGGVSPYVYNWSSGSTGATASDLIAGDHSLIVTDHNNCIIPFTVTITEPDALQGTMTITDALCYGSSTGTAFIDVVGGVQPYTYTWAPDNGADDGGLVAGEYSITVVDGNECVLVQRFNISEPTPLKAVSTHVDVCCHGSSDGTASVNVTGGVLPYTFTWGSDLDTGNQTEDTGLPAGRHNVTIMDSNGCILVHNFDIDQPEPLVVSTTVKHVACHSNSTGSISSSVTGGVGNYTYQWSTGHSTDSVTDLPAGVYSLTVTDAHGVQNTSTAIILQPEEELKAHLETSELICPKATDAWARVNVTGGSGAYTFAWSSNIDENSTTWESSIAQATLLASNMYEVTITDSNSCVLTKSFTIVEPETFCQNEGVCMGHQVCECGDDWEGIDCSVQKKKEDNSKAMKIGVGVGIGVGVPVVAGAIAAIVFVTKSSMVSTSAAAAVPAV